MKEIADNYIKSYESLNKWVKFLFNFLWAIPTNLYRLAKSAKKDDVLGMVVAFLLLIFCGFWVLAIFDLLTIAIKDKVYWIDDFQLMENDSSTSSDNEKKDGDADKID